MEAAFTPCILSFDFATSCGQPKKMNPYPRFFGMDNGLSRTFLGNQPLYQPYHASFIPEGSSIVNPGLGQWYPPAQNYPQGYYHQPGWRANGTLGVPPPPGWYDPHNPYRQPYGILPSEAGTYANFDARNYYGQYEWSMPYSGIHNSFIANPESLFVTQHIDQQTATFAAPDCHTGQDPERIAAQPHDLPTQNSANPTGVNVHLSLDPVVEKPSEPDLCRIAADDSTGQRPQTGTHSLDEARLSESSSDSGESSTAQPQMDSGPNIRAIKYYLAHKRHLDGLSRSETEVVRRQASEQFRLRGDVLLIRNPKKKFVVCPETDAERQRIVREQHCRWNHARRDYLIKRISEEFYWRTMRKDVLSITEACEECQKRGRGLLKPQDTLQHVTIKSRAWYLIGMDLIRLPLTSRGNQYALTLVDYWTKMAVAVPLPNKEGVTVAKALFEHVYSRFGAPQRIITDNGREFVNEVNREMNKILGIIHSTTRPYTPRANGMIERMNGTVKRNLETKVGELGNDWDEHLNSVMFEINIRPSAATGFAPFELMHTFRPRISTSKDEREDDEVQYLNRMDAPEFVDEMNLQCVQTVQRYAEIQSMLRDAVTSNIQKERLRQKISFDKRNKNSGVELREGQRVMFRPTKKGNQLHSKTAESLGPGMVVEVMKNHVRISYRNEFFTISNKDVRILKHQPNSADESGEKTNIIRTNKMKRSVHFNDEVPEAPSLPSGTVQKNNDMDQAYADLANKKMRRPAQRERHCKAPTVGERTKRQILNGHQQLGLYHPTLNPVQFTPQFTPKPDLARQPITADPLAVSNDLGKFGGAYAVEFLVKGVTILQSDIQELRGGKPLSPIVLFALGRLIKDSCANVSGFFTSDQLETPNFSGMNKSKTCVQIHFNDVNHFFVTSWDESARSVLYFDSLDMRPNWKSQLQIWRCYGSGETELRLLPVAVKRQIDGVSCGLFAAVFAYLVARGKNPKHFDFEIADVRQWIELCLRGSCTIPAPVTENSTPHPESSWAPECEIIRADFVPALLQQWEFETIRNNKASPPENLQEILKAKEKAAPHHNQCGSAELPLTVPDLRPDEITETLMVFRRIFQTNMLSAMERSLVFALSQDKSEQYFAKYRGFLTASQLVPGLTFVSTADSTSFFLAMTQAPDDFLSLINYDAWMKASTVLKLKVHEDDKICRAVSWFRGAAENLSLSERLRVTKDNALLNDSVISESMSLVKINYQNLNGLRNPMLFGLTSKRDYSLESTAELWKLRRTNFQKEKSTSRQTQILFVGGCHFVVVTNQHPGDANMVFIYDSLGMTKGPIMEFQLRHQIAAVFRFRENEFHAIWPEVECQPDNRICGVYAIATVVSIGACIDPSSVKYNWPNLRKHLLHCLENRAISPFPMRSTRAGPELKTTRSDPETIEVMCVCRMPAQSKIEWTYRCGNPQCEFKRYHGESCYLLSDPRKSILSGFTRERFGRCKFCTDVNGLGIFEAKSSAENEGVGNESLNKNGLAETEACKIPGIEVEETPGDPAEKTLDVNTPADISGHARVCLNAKMQKTANITVEQESAHVQEHHHESGSANVVPFSIVTRSKARSRPKTPRVRS